MSFMRIATIAARLLLGAAFFVFGLNGFLNFIPTPTQLPEFISAMIATGYLLPLVKGVEVLCGVLLLTGLYVPLALVLLAPVMVNIVLFHAYLAPPDQMPMSLILAALQLFVMWSYRPYYRPLFTVRAKPACCTAQKCETV